MVQFPEGLMKREDAVTREIRLFMHFCPGTMTTHAESINSDLQRGLDRRLRHTRNIEHRTEPVSHESISGQLILPQR